MADSMAAASPHFWENRLPVPNTQAQVSYGSQAVSLLGQPVTLWAGTIPSQSVRPVRPPKAPDKSGAIVHGTSPNISVTAHRLSREFEILDSLFQSTVSNIRQDSGRIPASPLPTATQARGRGRPKGSLNKKERHAGRIQPPSESSTQIQHRNIPFHLDPEKVASLVGREPTPEKNELREYKCKLCSLTFFNRSDVIMHTRSHTEGKPFKCDGCGKGFASSSYLNQHLRIHTGEKPYTCTYCDKTFRQLSHLQQHTRTHTGARPYLCSHPGCDKSFTQLSNLQQHWRRHNKDKPYKCPDCYRAFDVLEKLQNHVRSHENTRRERKFACRVCGKLYVQELYLERHMTNKHSQGGMRPPPPLTNPPTQIPIRSMASTVASEAAAAAAAGAAAAAAVAAASSNGIPSTSGHQHIPQTSFSLATSLSSISIPRGPIDQHIKSGIIAKSENGESQDTKPKEVTSQASHKERVSMVAASALHSGPPIFPISTVSFPFYNTNYTTIPGFSSLRS